MPDGTYPYEGCAVGSTRVGRYEALVGAFVRRFQLESDYCMGGKVAAQVEEGFAECMRLTVAHTRP